MKVAAYAQAYDLPVAPHGNQDIHVHLATAVPNGLFVEYLPPFKRCNTQHALLEPLELVDGYVSSACETGVRDRAR